MSVTRFFALGLVLGQATHQVGSTKDQSIEEPLPATFVRTCFTTLVGEGFDLWNGNEKHQVGQINVAIRKDQSKRSLGEFGRVWKQGLDLDDTLVCIVHALLPVLNGLDMEHPLQVIRLLLFLGTHVVPTCRVGPWSSALNDWIKVIVQ